MNERIKTFIPWEEIEKEAQEQIINTSKLPFLFKWVAIMPDCHFGKGATVGTVLATKGAVCPAAVGVDIGCGMIAVKTNLKRSQFIDLGKIREGIERRIPMSAGKFNAKIYPSAEERVKELEITKGVEIAEKLSKKWREQVGTLGGGNHFIEICVDENEDIWLTLHSGSRGVGNRIGMHYIKIAQDNCKKNFIELPDVDLAYLVEGTEDFNNYIRDLKWAQKFAKLNRDEMMDRFITEIRHSLFVNNEQQIEEKRINCHHNFTQIEYQFKDDVWVTRKGAINANVGVGGMIPGSMGTKSYIVSGLGNPLSFSSAPHGAGRRMSRNKARGMFKMEDMEKAMEGIEFRKSDVLLDEIPGAYKDIEKTMEYAKDLVRVEYTLKQIMNCKGD